MTDTERDADTLARFLEGDGSLNGQVTEETRALAGLAHRLQGAAVQPELDRRRELRDELLVAARERAADLPARGRLRRWLTGPRRRSSPTPVLPRLAGMGAAGPRLAAVLGAAIIAVSGGGIAYGADVSLPGDPLYSVKLVAEETRLAFVADRSDRGSIHLERAAERISEAEASAASGDGAGAAVALRHANGSARAGAGAILHSYETDRNPELIHQLASFTTTQSGRLTTLASGLDGEAADAAESTLVAFERIEARATALGGSCPGCGDATPASPPAGSPERDGGPLRQGKSFDSNGAGSQGGVEPVPPESLEPATPSGELDPPQPEASTPDTPKTNAPADAPADAPATTPNAPDTDDAPVDPPTPDRDTEPRDLVPRPETPDLPF